MSVGGGRLPCGGGGGGPGMRCAEVRGAGDQCRNWCSYC